MRNVIEAMYKKLEGRLLHSRITAVEPYGDDCIRVNLELLDALGQEFMNVIKTTIEPDKDVYLRDQARKIRKERLQMLKNLKEGNKDDENECKK